MQEWHSDTDHDLGVILSNISYSAAQVPCAAKARAAYLRQMRALECFFRLANPLYLIALYGFFKNKKPAIVPSIAASIIAISFSFMETVTKNEGGARTAITGVGTGYILWVASLSTLTLGVLFTEVVKGNKSTENGLG